MQKLLETKDRYLSGLLIILGSAYAEYLFVRVNALLHRAARSIPLRSSPLPYDVLESTVKLGLG